MKIAPIRINNLINFKSKVTNVFDGEISDELAQKIDDFEETHKGAKRLGSGLFATAYLLDGTNCVIKESLRSELARKQNQDFFPEAEALAMVPTTVQNSQRLVAHVKTEKNNHYLLSTFVEGEPASYPDNPWTKNSFDGLFDTLFALDREGIYHNDINEANCLIDDQHRASTIDYQFAQYFLINNSENEDNFKTKSNMMPSNAQMFEMASLPWYIKTMSETASPKEVRELFKTYLESKSKYAKQRAMYLQHVPNAKEKAKYEFLQAKYFENPTNEITDLQAKKLQLLYSFRKTFSVTDPKSNQDKNIASAIQSYIYTLAAAKDMENYANYLAGETDDDPNLKAFYELEADYARFWFNTMKAELALGGENGVYPWIERNVELNPRHRREYITEEDSEGCWSRWFDFGVPKEEDLSENFEASEHIRPENIEDIAGMIIEERAEESLHTYNVTEKNEIKFLAGELERQLGKDNQTIRPNTINKEVVNYLMQKQRYMNHSKDTINYAKNESFNAVIASAVLAQYQKNMAKKTLNDLAGRVELGDMFVNLQKDLLNGDFNLDILKKTVAMLIGYIGKTTGEEVLESKKFLRFV